MDQLIRSICIIAWLYVLANFCRGSTSAVTQQPSAELWRDWKTSPVPRDCRALTSLEGSAHSRVCALTQPQALQPCASDPWVLKLATGRQTNSPYRHNSPAARVDQRAKAGNGLKSTFSLYHKISFFLTHNTQEKCNSLRTYRGAEGHNGLFCLGTCKLHDLFETRGSKEVFILLSPRRVTRLCACITTTARGRRRTSRPATSRGCPLSLLQLRSPSGRLLGDTHRVQPLAPSCWGIWCLLVAVWSPLPSASSTRSFAMSGLTFL